jgi:hypothetical protein
MESQNIAQVEDQMEAVSSLNAFQQVALEKAEQELEAIKNELASKKYLIDIKKEDIVRLQNFNTNDAPWKFTESLGVIEVEKDLQKAAKDGNLYIGAIAIEAIYYYLSKVEGKGKTTNATAFENVDDYIRVLKAVTGGMEKVKADNDKLRHAEFVAAARKEGIDTDSEAQQP